MASAVVGTAHMAWQSLSAWLAAILPNRNGSLMNERKKSTVCTLARPWPSVPTLSQDTTCKARASEGESGLFG
eukprot:1218971-Rhodomonas_salina.1